MRRNNRNKAKKERIIMIASSAFVLAALTMTGVYMKETNERNKDDGYSVDFTEIEENVEDKVQEIAENIAPGNPVDDGEDMVAQVEEQTNMENDLDYMPMEVDSGLVEIPGLTEGLYTEGETVAEVTEAAPEEIPAEQEVSGQNIIVEQSLSFSEDMGLTRPATGEILMNYSMDGSIYFATLDQYRYNPAVIFTAQVGEEVHACAAAKVVDIYNDAKLGHVVVLELGNGYQAVYGQVEDIKVVVGDTVAAGDVIASVSTPTKYYSVEGSNLYFELTKDGQPVNPEPLF